jgi:tRNA-splicing ligase RtcB
VAALHSGSRAVGNKIAMHHIKVAHALMERCWITLPDKDLAYLVEGTPEFDRYIAELRWAQHFALLNREEFMDRVVRQFSEWMSQPVVEAERINCHPPHPRGRHVAARRVGTARRGPTSPSSSAASAGTSGSPARERSAPASESSDSSPDRWAQRRTVVEGLGDAVALESSPHGAGREYSRSAARKKFTVDASGRPWATSSTGTPMHSWMRFRRRTRSSAG